MRLATAIFTIAAILTIGLVTASPPPRLNNINLDAPEPTDAIADSAVEQLVDSHGPFASQSYQHSVTVGWFLRLEQRFADAKGTLQVLKEPINIASRMRHLHKKLFPAELDGLSLWLHHKYIEVQRQLAHVELQMIDFQRSGSSLSIHEQSRRVEELEEQVEQSSDQLRHIRLQLNELLAEIYNVIQPLSESYEDVNAIKDFQCSICLSDASEGACDVVQVRRCRHQFCRQCLEAHIQSGLDRDVAIKCPNCRASLSPTEEEIFI